MVNQNDFRFVNSKALYEGKHFFTKPNKQGFAREFVIIQYNATNDVIIQFINSDYRIKTSITSINKGIRDPFETEHSVVVFTDPYKKYMGTCYKTNEGYLIQVVEYFGTGNVTIQFLDSGLLIHNCTMQNIKNGQVKNPFHPNKFGGYTGVGPYSTDEYSWLYQVWYNMLIRTQDKDYYIKYHGTYTDAYDYVLLHPDWLNYNIFAHWYIMQLQLLNPNFKYEIDKDLLYNFYKKDTNGYKMYSPTTCILLPVEINKLLSSGNLKQTDLTVEGAEKRKQKLIEIANYYKEEGALSSTTYDAILLYNLNTNVNVGIVKDANLRDRISKNINKKLNK